MPFSWKELRRAELLELRAKDPAKLLAIYRKLMGLDVESVIPPGVSFPVMIDAILEHEASSSQRKQSG